MKCEKCGTEFEGNFCPNCGEQSNVVIKQKQISKKTGWIIFICFIVIIAGLTTAFTILTPQNQQPSLRTELIYVAQDIVGKNLKSPSTADFPMSTDKSYIVNQIDNTDTYVVQGIVDAENSYGAKLRNKYTVKFEYHPDKKEYKSLSVEIK